MLTQQTQQAAAKKLVSAVAKQKLTKRQIKISKIKFVPAMIAAMGTVVDTQY